MYVYHIIWNCTNFLYETLISQFSVDELVGTRCPRENLARYSFWTTERKARKSRAARSFEKQTENRFVQLIYYL